MAYLSPATGHVAPIGAMEGLYEVSIHRDFNAVADVWRRLEREALLTPYQHLDFAQSWWREIGRQQGIEPLIVVGRNRQGKPGFLWPLGQRRQGPFTIAESLGGKHANYHFGPWDDAVLPQGAKVLADALHSVAELAPHIDVILLKNQTREWNGHLNPFATLPHGSSPSDAYHARLETDPDSYMQRVMSHDARKQVRSKTRKFEALSGYRMGRAEEPAEIDELIDTFLAQKAESLAAMGVSDPFAAPGTVEFLRSLARPSESGEQLLSLYGLHAEGRLIAIMGGVGDGKRFSGMFNSYAHGPHAKLTPGYVLTAHVVADLCRRGYETFDLGVGEARYKNHFCDETQELIDVCVPLTFAGHIYAVVSRERGRAKRLIKRTPWLWNAVTRLRRRRLA